MATWKRDAAKIIFEGRVEKQEARAGQAPAIAFSMSPSGSYRVVTMTPARFYRGATQSAVTVVTGMGDSDCGFDFRTGKDYLVYAEPSKDGHTLFTSICSGTAALDRAGPELRLLRGDPPTQDDLTDQKAYNLKFWPQWTGGICGKVTKKDGTPFGNAAVEAWEIREEPFPPHRASELSEGDGTFCITNVEPGRYLLTAEDSHVDEGYRYMGFYPGIGRHADAVPIEVKAGEKMSNIHFTVNREPLFLIRISVVKPGGAPLSWHGLGVAVDSPDTDGLAYHISHLVENDGSYTFGGIPPGRYSVRTLFEPDYETGKLRPEAQKWRPTKKDVEVTGDTRVTLKLDPQEK